MLGVTRQAVQARVKKGSIRAAKVAGEWRIPAAVAKAVVGAEHAKAVASGGVTVLPTSTEFASVADLAEVVVGLENRLARVEAEQVAQASRFEEALIDLRGQLEARDADIGALREDRRRLRRALAALVAENEP